MKINNAIFARAQGCLLGQCAGDALGQMVEFWSKRAILHRYPDGVQDMENGGAFNTLAGQPTDDTEMALMLARSIVKEKKFDAKKVYRLLHAKDTVQAIIETVGEGGDTDTNGCICGALVGAVYGVDSIPERWRNAVLNCRPSADNPEAKNPRPECFWTIDVLELAEKLLTV